jgi:hypothetical protein
MALVICCVEIVLDILFLTSFKFAIGSGFEVLGYLSTHCFQNSRNLIIKLA